MFTLQDDPEPPAPEVITLMLLPTTMRMGSFVVEWVFHDPNGRDTLHSQTCVSIEHGVALAAASNAPTGTTFEIWQLIDGSGANTRLIHRGTINHENTAIGQDKPKPTP